MPSIPIHLQAKHAEGTVSNPLPSILQTPSGLAMIEFQGSVIIEGDDSDRSTPAFDLGRLVFPSASGSAISHDGDVWDGKRVFLFVGKHQRLTGEVKKLAKPLAVVSRRAANESTRESSQEELEVTAILTQKILFANRPEPVSTEQVTADDG